MKTYPLLQSQLGVLLESMQHPESTQYNLPNYIFMPLELTMERIVKATQTIVDSFPELHTRFVVDDRGEVRQWPDMQMPIPVVSRRCTEAELQAYISEGFVRPFSLFGAEPLFRVEVVETEQHLCLLSDGHHAIIDGMSFAPILTTAFATVLSGGSLVSSEKQITIYQAAEEETAQFGTERYQQAKAYYAQRFAGQELATLSRSKPGTTGRMCRCTTTVGRSEVDDWCREHGTQANLLFQAAFSHVLSVFTRQERVAYAAVNHGRMDKRLRGSLGMFVKSVPILVDAAPSQRVVDFVKSLRGELMSTIRYSIYPFTHFCSDLGMKPGIMFNFMALADMEEQVMLDGVMARAVQPVREEIDSDLSVDIYLRGESYEIRVQSSLAMNDEATLRMVGEAVRVAVVNMMAHPELTLGELELVSDEEREALVRLGTGEHLDVEPTMTFVKAFELCARRTPDAVSVADATDSLTYGELSRRSDVLAHRLIASGVKPGDFVAVMLDRTIAFPLAVIAIHKAGAAYVPIDLEYPEERQRFMLEDCGAKVVIDSRFLEETDLAVSGETADHIDLSTPDGPAYMIYTSGSTGKPKGAVLHQAGLWNFIQVIVGMEGLTAADRIAIHRSFSFDAHVEDLFPVLTVGGSLHIMPSAIRLDLNAIRRFLLEHQITGGGYATAMGKMLLETFDDLPMRITTLGGEKLTSAYSDRIAIFNVYGPTECTVDTSYYKIEPGRHVDAVPIGRPVANGYYFLVDPQGRLVPRGAIGELCFAGIQVGLGYWQQPELTASVFTDCPFLPPLTPHPSPVRMYHTGDLGRWNDEGQMEYIGRKDAQVKLRGYRIELGEIEACATRFDGIAQAVAVIRPLAGSDALCLYYTTGGEGTTIDTDELRQFLGRTLADYMVPVAYMQLDALPLTPNGKVDRRRLPEPQQRQEAIVAPATELERQLCAIVAEQLGTDAFGVTTNLVSLGMTSLDAMRLSLAIGKQTGLMVTVSDLLANPTVRHIAEESGKWKEESGERKEERTSYPLTENQRGIYIDWELHRNTTQYNVPVAIGLGQLDAQLLADALRQVVDAHRYIKTRLAEQDGSVVQLRRDDAPVQVTVTELDREPDSDFFQQRVRPFNLFTDDLYRLEIYTYGGRTWLFKDFHHIVSDGLSDAIFFRDMLAACQGTRPEAETVTAFDYALYEQGLKDTDRYAEARHYFDALVSGVETASYPHSANGTVHQSKQVKATVADSEAIRKACHRMGITPNSYFQTVVAQVLHRLIRQDSLMLATVSNGRSLTQTENLMGMFVKTLPMVSVLSPDDLTFSAAAQTMHRQSIETIGYDFYPFTEMVERHGLRPEILYAFEEGIYDHVEDAIDSHTDVIMLNLDTQKMPIELAVHTDRQGAYVLLLGFDSAIYTQTSMEALAKAISSYATHATQEGIRLSEIALTTADERTALVELGTGEHLDIDPTMTFVKAFEQRASLTPDKLAVADAADSLTYGELSLRSNILAHRLIESGVNPGDFVAVMLPRTIAFPLAVIAIHKAGAAYVPIDLDYPEERKQYMLDHSQAKLVIDSQFMKETDFAVSGETADNIDLSCPDGLAYMIYTSGSTGRPKGVMIRQANLWNFVQNFIHVTRMTAEDRVSAHRSFSFDAHLKDLYAVLVQGGSLHIMPEHIRRDLHAIRQFIIDNRITVAGFTTTLGMLVLDTFDDLPIRLLNVGGERLHDVYSDHIVIVNCYGPTECTDDIFFYRIEPGQRFQHIPVGRPVSNGHCFLIDTQGHLVPRGAVGELCFAGVQVASGYWRQPELTAEKFTDCPFLPPLTTHHSPLTLHHSPFRMYHTGDLCRWNVDGLLEYVGRKDDQVKLRGFRIEFGEVESRAAHFEEIKQAVAVVRKLAGSDTLCLYYTANHPDTTIDANELRRFMAQTLAEYMVPAAYMQLDTLPLTPSGKVDRRQLPEPHFTPHTNYVAPQTKEEDTLARLMANVLSLSEPVSMTDSFFALGGDSIKLIRLVTLLRNEGFTAQVSELMQCSTVADMARILVSSSDGPAISQESVEGAITPGAIQQRFLSWQLSQPGRYTQSVVLRALQPIDATLLRQALQALAVHHDMLRAIVNASDNGNGSIVIRPATDDHLFAFDEITLKSQDDVERAVADATLHEGERLDLEHGPILRVVLLHAADGDRLLMVCHHIACDGVSWRIITEDLTTALTQLANGQTVVLPAKSHAFGYWTNTIARYRDSYLLSQEKPYWQSVQQQMESTQLTSATAGKRSTRKLSVTLEGKPVRQLLTISAKAYNTEINDLLVTALCQSYHRLTGSTDLTLQMEGHGREPLHEPVVTDRTVGWFTAVYPVVIQTISGDIRSDVRYVKEQLHAVPNKGIGYGILQYIASQEGDAALKTDLTPLMGFNYLGEADSGKGDALFTADSGLFLSEALTAGELGVPIPSIVINCGIVEGRFVARFEYDTDRWTGDEAKQLADGFVSCLAQVAEHTAQVNMTEPTASDFGATGWTEKQFQDIVSHFAARGETLQRVYSLTPLQEGILIAYLSDRNSTAYRLFFRLSMSMLPTEAMLRRTLDYLAEKHEVLRTAILYDGVPQPCQAIVNRQPGLEMLDLTGEPDIDAAAARIHQDELHRPLSLTDDPLFRLVCMKTGDNSCQLLVFMHHIITDGWCNPIIFRDFLMKMEAEADGKLLTAGGHQQGGYETFVRQLLRRDRKTGLDYWKSLLADYDTRAAIPSYGKPASTPAKPFIRYSFDGTLATSLRQLAAKTGVTLNTVLELGWGLMLQLFCRTDDAVFLRVVSGRNSNTRDDSQLVGLCINSVPVRVHTTSTDTITQSLKALQAQAAQSANYDFCPLSDIQQQTGLGSSLFQSIMALENYPLSDTLSAADPRWSVKPVQIEEEAIGELTVTINPETNGTLRLTFSYDTSLYGEQQIRQIAETFETIVRNMAAMPDRLISELPLITEEAKTGLIQLGRGEQLDFDHKDTLVSLFRRKAAATPDATAVVFGDRRMTYGELDQMTDSLASHIINIYGVQPEEAVGVMIDRSELMVVYPLAIMKAGGCYMPLDYSFPADRLEYMCEDAGVRLILSEGDRVAQAMPGFHGSVFVSTTHHSPLTTHHSPSSPHPSPLTPHEPNPSDRFVILYTSGSTGRPKGVALEHHSIVNFCHWYNKEFRMTSADRALAFSNFGFDAHLMDLYPALTAGASVHIISSEMRMDLVGMNHYMEENAISIAFLTTQVGHLFASTVENCSLRLLSVGGEKLMPVRKPPYEFYNCYGPTECTICTTWYKILEDYDSSIIGLPLANYQLYVVDASMRLLPSGAAGELIICGEGVGRGYLHPSAEDAGKFTVFNGQRAYRTGDLVRWADDGNLEFLGRIDNQVKLRGLRIEMGEIEACASRFTGIGQVTAQVVNGQYVCLYYTADADVDINALKRHLADNLAAYMVPTAYMRLDAIPLNANGKVDRRQLPEPSTTVKTEGLPPHTEKEAVLLLVAQQVLGRDDFGITDDLFDLGLTSITAIKVAAMSEAFGVHISVNNLQRARTIERLFSAETPVGYWFNTYSPEKPVLISPHGVVPVISMTEKFQEWQDYFSIYTFEPADEHASRLSPDLDYEKLVCAYSDLLERDIPADARVFGFIGYSWGGEMGYSLAARWQQRHGGKINVYLCDTFIFDPDSPKMTEEQITQGIIMYLMSHAADFDTSGLQQADTGQNGGVLNMALMKCGKDTGFAGEILKITTKKFFYGELYRRSQPLPVFNCQVTYFIATHENPQVAENLAGWLKVAPTMKVIEIDDNHMNFSLRNDKTYLVTERLLEDLKNVERCTLNVER